MKELHIGLWGEDNFKNYTPLVALKNGSTLLILGPLQQQKAIIASLSGRYGSPLFLAWSDAPTEEDFYRLNETITDLNAEKISLNLSSGDRLNAMRLLQWALKEDIHAYLIDEKDQKHWLNPTNLPATQIHDLANLKEYFRVHQIKLLSHGMGLRINQSLRNMVEQWVLEFDHPTPFRYLNKLASTARPVEPPNDAQQYVANMSENWQHSSLATHLKDLRDNELVQLDNREILFTNDSARFFCNGGWLELFVYEQLCKLKRSLSTLQDVRLGLEILYPEQVKNELDVVFLANNQLHIIEIKTSYLSNDTSSANQLIYKLEALSASLGKEVKGMVVSLSDLPNSSIKRAGLYDIEVVSGQAIKRLPSRLSSWIQENSDNLVSIDERN